MSYDPLTYAAHSSSYADSLWD